MYTVTVPDERLRGLLNWKYERYIFEGTNPKWGKLEHITGWRRTDVLGCAQLCTVATLTREADCLLVS